MWKRNLRKSSYLLIGLFLLGLAGLFLALIELNVSYEVKYHALNRLTAEVNRLEGQMRQAKSQLDNLERLRFRSVALASRFPTFSRIVDTAFSKAHEYEFDPVLLMGIMEVESDFNPKAVSGRGAYGLMQVNIGVWKDELDIDRRRVFDIEYNIDLGLQILKRYFLETGKNVIRALHLYNNGYKYNNTAYVRKVNSVMVRSRRLEAEAARPPG